jgi:phosphatidylinositol 3-kinase
MGVNPEKVKVFTSATKPLLLPFYYRLKGDAENRPETFTMMFKTGDDMRQDQLVLQMFYLMDSVLREIGLDLQFSHYNLIAMTKDDGLLQFVPKSKTIQDILNEEKSIEKYLRSHAKTPEEYEQILNTYINSVAGYCNATYILGIGDRHMENLMIDNQGKFFHIDFGFMFGVEPNGFKKSLSTPIRISKEMVEPLGGIGSP